MITLAVEMRRMDRITFLRKIMLQQPIPVIVISSLTARGTETAIQALELGAVDVIRKTSLDRNNLQDAERNIIQVVKTASRAVIRRKSRRSRRMKLHPLFSECQRKLLSPALQMKFFL